MSRRSIMSLRVRVTTYRKRKYRCVFPIYSLSIVNIQDPRGSILADLSEGCVCGRACMQVTGGGMPRAIQLSGKLGERACSNRVNGHGVMMRQHRTKACPFTRSQCLFNALTCPHTRQSDRCLQAHSGLPFLHRACSNQALSGYFFL